MYDRTHALMSSVEIQRDVDIHRGIQKDTRHQSLYIYTRHLNDAVHAVMSSVEIQEDIERYTERHSTSKSVYLHERWGAGVEYHFQEFNEPYAPS